MPSSSRHSSRTGRPDRPVTERSRSSSINGVRIAIDPCATSCPVVEDHHHPGPQLRPGTAGHDANRPQLLEAHLPARTPQALLDDLATRRDEARIHPRRVHGTHPSPRL